MKHTHCLGSDNMLFESELGLAGKWAHSRATTENSRKKKYN